jgi:hypothetical protein
MLLSARQNESMLNARAFSGAITNGITPSSTTVTVPRFVQLRLPTLAYLRPRGKGQKNLVGTFTTTKLARHDNKDANVDPVTTSWKRMIMSLCLFWYE